MGYSDRVAAKGTPTEVIVTSRLSRYGAVDAPTDECWMLRATVTFWLRIDEGYRDDPNAGGGDSRATSGRRISDTAAIAESGGRVEG